MNTEEIDYNSRENKIAVFTAWLDGKPWQSKPINDPERDWVTRTEESVPPFSQFYLYRVKPTPKRVPLEAKDVPPVCWLRANHTKDNHTSVGQIGHSGVHALARWDTEIKYEIMHLSFDVLFSEGFEYSTDRVNWSPCSKEVSE